MYPEDGDVVQMRDSREFKGETAAGSASESRRLADAVSKSWENWSSKGGSAAHGMRGETGQLSKSITERWSAASTILKKGLAQPHVTTSVGQAATAICHAR